MKKNSNILLRGIFWLLISDHLITDQVRVESGSGISLVRRSFDRSDNSDLMSGLIVKTE